MTTFCDELNSFFVCLCFRLFIIILCLGVCLHVYLHHVQNWFLISINMVWGRTTSVPSSYVFWNFWNLSCMYYFRGIISTLKFSFHSFPPLFWFFEIGFLGRFVVCPSTSSYRLAGLMKFVFWILLLFMVILLGENLKQWWVFKNN